MTPIARFCWGLVAAVALAVLAGCATPPPEPSFPPSYVVLVPSPDGSVGRVTVEGQAGRQELAQAGQAASADGAVVVDQVPPERLARDFEVARQAQPLLPERFLLYFETGGARLTPESEALLPRVLQRITERGALGMVDVSIIGHTDTVGRPEVNARVSLERAQFVAQRLQALGLPQLAMQVESHGETNLLVPTPDETPEPRNRRVEITLR